MLDDGIRWPFWHERPCPAKFQVSDIDLKLHWLPFEIWELINFKASSGAQNGCQKHQHRQCDQCALKNELVLMKTISTELYL